MIAFALSYVCIGLAHKSLPLIRKFLDVIAEHISKQDPESYAVFPSDAFVNGGLVAVEWSILLLDYMSPKARNEVLNRVRREVTQRWAMHQNQQRQDDH